LKHVQVGLFRRPGSQVRRDTEDADQGVAGGDFQFHGRDVQRLPAQIPDRDRRFPHRLSRAVHPFVHPAGEADGRLARAVVPKPDRQFQDTIRHQRPDIDVVHADHRSADEVHILPNAIDVTSPHRPGRDNPPPHTRAVLKQLLGLDEHTNVGFLPGTDEVGDVGFEREKQVEVLGDLLPAHEDLSPAGDSFEMQEYPVSGPVGRHPDRPLHPGLTDLVPGGRIGWIVAVVRPFQAVPSEAVHVPWGRNLDLDGVPCLRTLRPGLEVPPPVQAHLVAVRLLQPVDEPF
jgi:hypothetical protein